MTDDKTAMVWEWSSTYDPNCKSGPGAGISSAKLRYSPYYKRDVIIACSSNGWWGVIDYQARKLLCEGKLISGPHSVEMLPNGDLVVGVSNNPMGVYYIPLSVGIFEPVHSIESHSCHGVCWDPTRECLWVLDYDEVYAVTVENMGTAQAKLVRDESRVCTFKVGGKDYHDGHALSPIAGSPGKYWVSTVNYLWMFDSETMEMTREFDRYNTLNRRAIKGIVSFEDGTVVETVHNLGGGAVNFYACDGFRVISPTVGQNGQTVDVVTNAISPFMGRQFYKIQSFTKNYQ
ncbi:MAG: hypothetical protein J6B54_07115 [Clostridia bacterium]|nr:hypothetical protein [Clostridia bacterium]